MCEQSLMTTMMDLLIEDIHHTRCEVLLQVVLELEKDKMELQESFKSLQERYNDLDSDYKTLHSQYAAAQSQILKVQQELQQELRDKDEMLEKHKTSCEDSSTALIASNKECSTTRASLQSLRSSYSELVHIHTSPRRGSNVMTLDLSQHTASPPRNPRRSPLYSRRALLSECLQDC